MVKTSWPSIQIGGETFYRLPKTKTFRNEAENRMIRQGVREWIMYKILWCGATPFHRYLMDEEVEKIEAMLRGEKN